MFKYETHLHTSPVSRCGRATVRETLTYYQSVGYDGVFLTNHFLDGNINIEWERPYEEKINFYFSDYEEALKIGDEIGFKVFLGVEMSCGGCDFLVYGIDKEWFLAHPEIIQVKKSEALTLLAENGAFIVHAHPFREASYIDHIRLFPRHVHAVEVFNARRTDFENHMANVYAEEYGLLKTAGSDNHSGGNACRLGGILTEKPINSVADYAEALRNHEVQLFAADVGEEKSFTILE